MVANTHSESELISRAVGGDRDALSQLLYLHYDRLAKLVAQKVPLGLAPFVSTDDVMQEIFVQAFRSIDRLENRGTAAFSKWLATLAQNRLQDLTKANYCLKREGKHRRVNTPEARSSSIAGWVATQVLDDHDTPSQIFAKDEIIKAVEIAIADLPEDQRDAVHLRYIKQLSLEQTADELHRSPAAVRGLVHRAKLSLRSSLGRSTRWFYRK
jgi:RNA polymerase sigma-70 factor (ECF subfamily)